MAVAFIEFCEKIWNNPANIQREKTLQALFARIFKDFRIDENRLYNLSGGISDKKAEKKLKKVQDTYAAPSRHETPLLLLDNTIFGNAKEGFLLTDTTLYYSNVLDSGAVVLDTIDDVQWNRPEEKLTLLDANGDRIADIELTILQSKNQRKVVRLIDRFCKALKIADDLHQNGAPDDTFVEHVMQALKEAESAAETKAQNEASRAETSTPAKNDTAAPVKSVESESPMESSVQKVEKVADGTAETVAAKLSPNNERFVTLTMLGLTPLYLFLVYFKTLMGADIDGLISISVLILVIYVPIGAAVTDNRLPVSIRTVITNTSLPKYLYLVIGLTLSILLLAFVDSLHINFRDKQNIGAAVSIVVYGFWWFISGHLNRLAKEGSDATRFKVLFWTYFILTLLIIRYLPPLPNEINFEYFVKLLYSMFHILVIISLFIPQVGRKILGVLFGMMAKKGYESVFGSKKKKRAMSLDGAMQGLGTLAFFALMFYGVVFVPFMNWLTTTMSSIDPFWTSALFTTAMILVSAFGASFQLRLFFSYFWEDEQRVWKATRLALVAFYSLLLLNIGYLNKINKNAAAIEKTQKTIEQFNDKVQGTIRHY